MSEQESVKSMYHSHVYGPEVDAVEEKSVTIK